MRVAVTATNAEGSATATSAPSAVVSNVAAPANTASPAVSGTVAVGWLPTLVATFVSFVVAYAAVAWLLRFVAGHKITWFVWYRWTVAAVLIIALSTGALAAT